jgi:hypothetical protein
VPAVRTTAGYGLVSYWTAYLKASYPVDFMAAQLTSIGDSSVAVVVILGHPPEVDLVDGVADDVECVLGNWSRADELVLFEGPSSREVVVDHLAHLGA